MIAIDVEAYDPPHTIVPAGHDCTIWSWRVLAGDEVLAEGEDARSEGEVRAFAERVAKAVAPEVGPILASLDQWRGRVHIARQKPRQTPRRSSSSTPGPSGPVVLLVACSGVKAPTAMPSRMLYRGSLYRQRVEWCRAVHKRDPDAILSALHHVVDPDQVIEPYDVKIDDLDKDQRARWDREVTRQLLLRWPSGISSRAPKH